MTSSDTPPFPISIINPCIGNTPVGGGAPIGSGLAIMLALGAAYGGKKVWDFRSRYL